MIFRASARARALDRPTPAFEASERQFVAPRACRNGGIDARDRQGKGEVCAGATHDVPKEQRRQEVSRAVRHLAFMRDLGDGHLACIVLDEHV
ncbi:MAG: hypothetical protein HC868_06270 [Sphingomonadales bacterium]|nr:hypothetical protein [Sphingomonadales bacterium]